MESRPSIASRLLPRIFSFPVFLGAILAGIVFHLANRGVADPDLWLHLRNTEHLLQTHQFMRADIYSYTARGAPWIDIEWLSEIAYYLAWKAWGLRGIFVLMAALIETVMLGIFYLSYLVSGNVKSAFIGSWIAMFLATVSFAPRSLLFGWIFLIALLAILWRYKAQGKDALWAIPPLFLVWINSHGTWLIGLVVFGIFITAGLFDGIGQTEPTPRWTPAQLRKLLLIAGVTVLALFVNPYGYKLVVYPFDLAYRQTVAVSMVQEWGSTDFHELRGKILLGSIFIVLTVTLLRKQRWRVELFGLFLFAVYSAVSYVRFMFLAGIIFAPILARTLDFVPEYERKKDKPVLNAVFVIAVIAFIVLRFPSESNLAQDVKAAYPVDAARQLQSLTHGDGGRILNDYQWGGYLILNYPDIPVFVDSRADVFEHQGVLKEYKRFLDLKESLEVTDNYHIRYALLTSKSSQAYFLAHAPGWRTVYRDDVATIFANDRYAVIAQNQSAGK